MRRSSGSPPQEISILKSLLSFFACMTVAGLARAADRPNVLFIAVDDLRPELNCYGFDYIKSPNIDRIAKAGMVFDRAYCQQAVCSPTRSSLVTGTRPDTTEVWGLETHFRVALPNVVTLGQHFKQHGYFVQGMGKKAAKAADAAPSQRNIRGPSFESADVPDNFSQDGKVAGLAGRCGFARRRTAHLLRYSLGFDPGSRPVRTATRSLNRSSLLHERPFCPLQRFRLHHQHEPDRRCRPQDLVGSKTRLFRFITTS
jgi:Sulfatase